MPDTADEEFYERADAHIHLSNDQMANISRGKVSASMLYGTARFNAWISACGFSNGSDMADKKDETVQYFVTEYTKMLKENLDDYIESFDNYMNPGE